MTEDEVFAKRGERGSPVDPGDLGCRGLGLF